MSRHLFVTFSNPYAYRELFPIADRLVSAGHHVDFIRPTESAGFYQVPEHRKYYLPQLSKMDYYQYIHGFNQTVKEIKNLHSFPWVEEASVDYDSYDLLWGLGKWIDDEYFLRKHPRYRDQYVLVPQIRPGVPEYELKLGKHMRYFGWPSFDWLYAASEKPYNELTGYVLYMKQKFFDVPPRRGSYSSDLANMRDGEFELQRQFLGQLIVTVVKGIKRPLVIKSFTIAPFDGEGGDQILTQTMVNDVCETHGIDPLMVRVTDEYSGRYYKNAWCVLSHGSSELAQAMVLNDRIAVLAFPTDTRARNARWLGGHLRNFDELENALRQERFSNVRGSRPYKNLCRIFDGKCTERTVKFALECISGSNRVARSIRTAYYYARAESHRTIASLRLAYGSGASK